ncbi:dihydroorotate dehydrogenase-like protein [Xylariomycetidae sp. FL2044]|nr:dihydroorotate dehydrogenase-like protein [Xylariomycetidae sp. FL2044]
MSTLPPNIEIVPPLLNSANPWATSLEDLKALFECPSTGAVTTRTTLLNPFPHDPSIHQYTFFDPASHGTGGPISTAGSADHENASLNTLGYSPIPIKEYLGYIQTISSTLAEPSSKVFIISVTGSPEEVAECYRLIAEHQAHVRMPLAMEVNLSCPNIPNKPPPAYSPDSLAPYLRAVSDEAGAPAVPRIPWGLKTPPYTYSDQFTSLLAALSRGSDGAPCPISFITATNTLGSCLVLDGAGEAAGKPRLAGNAGIGGMAGAPLHALALGNVATLRRLLDVDESTRHVRLIGIGGVEDSDGYRRMRGVGAFAVGVGTALGRKGVGVFEEIEEGVGGQW